MKQYEVEQRIREMRDECKKEGGALIPIIFELQVKIDNLGMQAHNIMEQRKMLQVQRKTMQKQLNDINEKWRKRIKEFTDANYESATRNLCDVSDWALVNELKARGFNAVLQHPEKDDEYMERLNDKLGGEIIANIPA